MTISEVAAQYGLSIDTLRYYERTGLIPPVLRNKSGIRNYTEWDCNWVEFIKCMRQAGIPIEALIEYVSLFQKGDSTRQVRKEILIEQRGLLVERLAEMQKMLERLDVKIAGHDTADFQYERRLEAAQ